MFSRNGQYIINELEEDTFDKQLPSSSVKVPFKKEKQKIFNRMQKKYELQLLKQQIHQKCKAEELEYLDQLEKQKFKFNQMKQQEEKKRKQYLLNFVQKKYQIQQEKNIVQKTRSKTYQPLRDSIDDIKDLNNKKQNKNGTKNQLQFSLQPNEEKQAQKVKQDEWVKRVMFGRKVLEAKFGNYHSKHLAKHGSDSDSSQNAQ